MDKLFEQILKYLPGDIIPIALAAAAAFFGIYYYRGFRSYTDVLHDSLFLSTIVLIVAGSLLFRFNKTNEPVLSEGDPAPLLLVPEFVDDERGQFKTLFIQQVGSAIQLVTQRDKSILPLNSFLLDQDQARLTAQHFKAIAVIYGPRIVRSGEKVFLCFNLLRADSNLTKPYPVSAVELNEKILSDITQTLTNADPTAQAKLGAPPSRLDVMEKRVAELELALAKLVSPVQSPIAGVTYKQRRAIVVGVDKHTDRSLPDLRYSVSDAQRMASILQSYAFSVTVLTNATLSDIDKAINSEASKVTSDDLFLFYFAGNAIRSDELKVPGDISLIIGTSDLDLSHPTANLTLSKLVERVRAIPAGHKLVILDACYGTAGLKMPDISDPTIQIFSGSQDDQYAAENGELGGGVFTSALIGALQRVDKQTSVSMDRIAKEVSAQMLLTGSSRQQPKLVTSPGADQIVWTR